METWKDKKHKLEWQVELPGSMMWNDSMEYANSLGDGWRLPTIQELQTWLDRSKCSPAVREEVPFKESLTYWTSTIHWIEGVSSARGVCFYNGFVFSKYDNSNSFYVRCVRDLVE